MTDVAALPKALDIAFVRFRAPDLDRLQEFAERFGLSVVERTPTRLFMSGAGQPPFVYAASKGEPGFDGVAFQLESLAALQAFASRFAGQVEPLNGPGGGHRVRLTDPDGFPVEAVIIPETDTVLLDSDPQPPVNEASVKRRWNQEKRPPAGPSEVRRLGHAVLNVTDFRRSEAWYKERFGFITSDEIILEDGRAIGAFLRCDRGEAHTDHHTLFLLQQPEPAFNHAAFEVRDLDSLMAGHDHLAGHGYEHRWGVGRHVLGSQIFDYWRDPWGHVLEHWTDGDLMNAAWGSRQSPVSQLRSVQWGHTAPHPHNKEKS